MTILRRTTIWWCAATLGVVSAALLFVFELVGVELTAWLWDDVLMTDEIRWLVVPLAMVMSLLLTVVVKRLGTTRLVSVESDLASELRPPGRRIAFREIGELLIIGAVSLLGGAALGPEAALIAATSLLGAWVAQKFCKKSDTQLLILATVGALLVAFVSSALMALLPLVILAKEKSLSLRAVLIVGLASLLSLATVTLLRLAVDTPSQWSILVVPAIGVWDFVTALVVGVVAAFLAVGFDRLMRLFAVITAWINRRVGRYAAALIYGLVLGGLYLVGGETIQFSGSAGSHELLSDPTRYGILGLVILIATKMAVTAWSKASGYRGGVIFPSIYIGVAFGLLVGLLLPGLAGAGAIVGGIAGMIRAVTGSTVMAAVFVLAALPLGPASLLALCGIAGASVGMAGLRLVGDIIKRS